MANVVTGGCGHTGLRTSAAWAAAESGSIPLYDKCPGLTLSGTGPGGRDQPGRTRIRTGQGMAVE